MNQDYIIVAGGCFWGLERLFQDLDGVISTKVGYSGGNFKDPKYVDVKTGMTGHAEAVKVTFNNDIVKLFDVIDYFYHIHDPTTLNSQGNDIGAQYRSTLFYRNDEQLEVFKKVIEKIEEIGFWKSPIVTSFQKEDVFYDAEEFHQQYLNKNPTGYTCHVFRKF